MDDGVVLFRTQINAKTGPGEDTVLFQKYVSSFTDVGSPHLVNNNRINITYRTRSSTPSGNWCPSTRSEYMSCLRHGNLVYMNPAGGPT